jgi:hypothetical protein
MLVLRLTTILTVFSLALATPHRVVSHEQLFPLPGRRSETSSSLSSDMALPTEPLLLPGMLRTPPSRALAKRSPVLDLVHGAQQQLDAMLRYASTKRGQAVGAIPLAVSAAAVVYLNGSFIFMAIVGIMVFMNVYQILWAVDLFGLPNIPGLPPKTAVQSFSRQQQQAALKMLSDFAAHTGRNFRPASAAEARSLLKAAYSNGQPLMAKVA